MRWTYSSWPGILATFFLIITMQLLPLGIALAAEPDATQKLADANLLFLPLVLANDPASQLVEGLPFDPLEPRSGEATYYAATGAGNCSFPASPDNLMVAALNMSDYANAWLCGAYVNVNGPDGSVVVRIVDSCPGCKTGDIDLSREAFAQIAELERGRVPVSWNLVSPEISGPIVYQFKDGSNPYWTAVQIRNHRMPVHSVEYLADDGSFKPAPRLSYNYFVESSGMGSGPYTFRVMDIFGNVLTDSSIPLLENGEVEGSGQFPAP